MNKIDLFPTNKNDKYIVRLLDRCATKRELFSVVNLCIKPKAFSNDVMDIYDECFILFDFYNHCNGLSIDTKDNIINSATYLNIGGFCGVRVYPYLFYDNLI